MPPAASPPVRGVGHTFQRFQVQAPQYRLVPFVGDESPRPGWRLRLGKPFPIHGFRSHQASSYPPIFAATIVAASRQAASFPSGVPSCFSSCWYLVRAPSRQQSTRFFFGNQYVSISSTAHIAEVSRELLMGFQVGGLTEQIPVSSPSK